MWCSCRFCVVFQRSYPQFAMNGFYFSVFIGDISLALLLIVQGLCSHKADGRLTARSLWVSEPRDSDKINRSKIEAEMPVKKDVQAGMQRNNNVFTTSTRRRRRRDDVMKTLSLCHFCVMCPLGVGQNWHGTTANITDCEWYDILFGLCPVVFWHVAITNKHVICYPKLLVTGCFFGSHINFIVLHIWYLWRFVVSDICI